MVEEVIMETVLFLMSWIGAAAIHTFFELRLARGERRKKQLWRKAAR